jgi:hypothetical protein
MFVQFPRALFARVLRVPTGTSILLFLWIRKRLFDHLVGAAGHRQRDGDTERFSGLEVDD